MYECKCRIKHIVNKVKMNLTDAIFFFYKYCELIINYFGHNNRVVQNRGIPNVLLGICMGYINKTNNSFLYTE